MDNQIKTINGLLNAWDTLFEAMELVIKTHYQVLQESDYQGEDEFDFVDLSDYLDDSKATQLLEEFKSKLEENFDSEKEGLNGLIAQYNYINKRKNK